jgi:hypothetical protein
MTSDFLPESRTKQFVISKISHKKRKSTQFRQSNITMVQAHFFLTFLNVIVLCHGFSQVTISSRREYSISSMSTLRSSTQDTILDSHLTNDDIALFDERTGKPTGISFLPPSTIQRARDNGNPIEKIKLQKDGTSAFVDVYEYAKKIRNGEMTWEEVDKADLDSVCIIVFFL